MTAYSRSSVTTPIGRFACELQTLNRKFLEIQLHLPPELRSFDKDVRQWLASQLGCGQVSMTITVAWNKPPIVITPNVPLIKQIKAAWEQIAQEVEIDFKENFDWSLLTSEPGVLQYAPKLEEEKHYRQPLREVVEMALSQLIEMKEEEGRQLAQDIQEKLGQIERVLETLEKGSTEASARYRQKLTQRLEEILPGSLENEEKIVRELAIYAQKGDFSEEVTRLRSHLYQFSQLLPGKDGGVGKTMDFLLQEMLREATTLSVKAQDADISHRAIEIKSTLSKIREQIQNVE